MDTDAESDQLLARARLEFFREAWLGGTGVAWTNPRINLLQADLAGLPPPNVYYARTRFSPVWTPPSAIVSREQVWTSMCIRWKAASTPSSSPAAGCPR